LYTDAGECLLDRQTGAEVIISKCYGYNAWGVTVRKKERTGDRVRWTIVHSENGWPRKARPRRADLAELVDAVLGRSNGF
jgi:hypothetical protein